MIWPMPIDSKIDCLASWPAFAGHDDCTPPLGLSFRRRQAVRDNRA
jgi:hypothetical protein